MRTAARLFPLVVLAAACTRPAVPTPEAPAEAVEPGPGLHVTASYPGASSIEVAAVLAVPIEQQVNGVAGLTRMESESRDDGTYTLVVHFEPKTDLNAALTLVRNRVALAEPQLPEEVRRLGVTVRRGDPDRLPNFWVAVTGADAALLGALAEVRVRDELLRIPGIADARLIGASTAVARVWLDPDKLAARALTAEDVVRACREQKLRAELGGAPAGGGFPFTLTGLAGLARAEELERLVVKTTANGQVVYLRDVARTELGPRTDAVALANGKPAALIAVTADAGAPMTAAVRKTLAGIDEQLPKGVKVDLAADLTTGGFGVVELRLPAGADHKRTREVVNRAVKLLGGECVAFSDREPNAATLLVKPYADARNLLAGIKDATVRVSDLASGRPFPVRVALADTGGHGHEQLREWADAVAKQLAADGGALDPAVSPGPGRPQLNVRLDREKLAKLGVRATDVADALQAHTTGVVVDGLGGFGDAVVALDTAAMVESFSQMTGLDGLKRIEVKTGDGKTVPLGAVAEFREDVGSPAILRVNMHTALRITAAAPTGQKPADVIARVIKAAEAAAPKGGKVFALDFARP